MPGRMAEKEMAKENPKEQRFFVRYRAVKPGFPGRLLDASGHEINARIVDVSRDGLGVLLTRSLPSGSLLAIEIGDRRVELSVVYCLPDLIHTGEFRAGLRRRGADNLESWFAQLGLIEA